MIVATGVKSRRRIDESVASAAITVEQLQVAGAGNALITCELQCSAFNPNVANKRVGCAQNHGSCSPLVHKSRDGLKAIRQHTIYRKHLSSVSHKQIDMVVN